MGSRLTEVAVDCRDPEAQAAFWAAALGYHVVHREEGQVEIGPWVPEPPDLAEQVRRAPSVPTLVFAGTSAGESANAGMPYRGMMPVAAAATTNPLVSFCRNPGDIIK